MEQTVRLSLLLAHLAVVLAMNKNDYKSALKLDKIIRKHYAKEKQCYLSLTPSEYDLFHKNCTPQYLKLFDDIPKNIKLEEMD